MGKENQASIERRRLNFPHVVGQAFSFLEDMGFREIEAAPTIVRYRKDDLVCNVYHGRSSYELGFEIGPEGEEYPVSALIRASDVAAYDQYRTPVATTPAELASGIKRLADLVRQYGERALRGDPAFFAELRRQQKAWAEAYALDVLARQIRPKAEAAFRAGRYREAAELYAKIGPRLSPTEQKKLEAARKRS